ncbi:hypothetical protein V8G54_022856, partial [Vigna mungo]
KCCRCCRLRTSSSTSHSSNRANRLQINPRATHISSSSPLTHQKRNLRVFSFSITCKSNNVSNHRVNFLQARISIAILHPSLKAAHGTGTKFSLMTAQEAFPLPSNMKP